ncbi:MAG: 3-phosphoserine/phosphohydroxythreonine transaminase [Deltaproteobacteria bacterium]|nr:MAG: 3-phosphoserine/phosphohydroxythreonine transaminase [Deltaproteobacteria bacterium]
MAHRVFNFAPGPATLPVPALKRAQGDLLDYQGTGIGILEHSHRKPSYMAVHAETKKLLRDLLEIPDGYSTLFMQGGARGQFAIVPMNLLHPGTTADYVVTGTWGEKAVAEAKLVGEAREAANTAGDDGKHTRVPALDEIAMAKDAAYLHLTTNNTIYGTQFFDFPDTGDVPLILDMSSDICWQPMDVSKADLIYAGAQKNLGIPGVTLVIIKDELIEKGRRDIPSIFQYRTIEKADSLQNTAPTFAIYMMRNVLAWMADQGGLEEMERRNRKKAGLIYDAISAAPDFYRCPVEEASRSVMNVVFRLPTEELEGVFVEEAAAAELMGIKGHRSVGGMRVSLYNSMSIEGAEKLAELMGAFAKANG